MVGYRPWCRHHERRRRRNRDRGVGDSRLSGVAGRPSLRDRVRDDPCARLPVAGWAPSGPWLLAHWRLRSLGTLAECSSTAPVARRRSPRAGRPGHPRPTGGERPGSRCTTSSTRASRRIADGCGSRSTTCSASAIARCRWHRSATDSIRKSSPGWMTCLRLRRVPLEATLISTLDHEALLGAIDLATRAFLDELGRHDQKPRRTTGGASPPDRR